MIPVMTSTKTDKSTIDLAWVEAGAKILVPLAAGSPGALAQTPIADQNRRSMVSAKDRNVEDAVLIGNSLLKQGARSMYLPLLAKGLHRCTRELRKESCNLLPIFESQGLIALPKFVQQLSRAHDVTLQVRLPHLLLRCMPLAEFLLATSIS